MFHITCCAFRIRSFFKDVDNLICKIKMCTQKNNSNMLLFFNTGIPSPPIVIIIRCSSWLRATMYCSEYLTKITEIINTIANYKRQRCTSNLNIFPSLFQIKTSYQSLIVVIKIVHNLLVHNKIRVEIQ